MRQDLIIAEVSCVIWNKSDWSIMMSSSEEQNIKHKKKLWGISFVASDTNFIISELHPE